MSTLRQVPASDGDRPAERRPETAESTAGQSPKSRKRGLKAFIAIGALTLVYCLGSALVAWGYAEHELRQNGLAHCLESMNCTSGVSEYRWQVLRMVLVEGAVLVYLPLMFGLFAVWLWRHRRRAA